MAKNYKNFEIASYLYAYQVETISDEELKEGLERMTGMAGLSKMYIESHRGKIDIPVERLKHIKAICEEYGCTTAGGITATQFINGIRKPAIFDTFCYTDPYHRAKFVEIVRELASVFDEIILDDFFFTSCRCKMCIKAKGTRSWKDFRLDLMEEFAHVIVDESKAVNPNMKFVIKYPNWYESYQECGFNPGKQKDIFDGIYSGTETRSPYLAQHLQRYLSYSIIRLMNNSAPGKNGGGWIDIFGSSDNMSIMTEQAEATLYGKTGELTLWHFGIFKDAEVLPSLGLRLKKIDEQLSMFGNPVGVAAWEPFNGDGEDQVYNYLGMCGMPVEPSPYFNPEAKTVLCTESTAEVADSIDTLKEYVMNGGNAVVTIGYFKKMYDRGIKDMTSVRLTGRHVQGSKYSIHNANYWNSFLNVSGDATVMFEALDYKTNASNSDITLMVDEDNFPIMTEDNYGDGRLFILNLPENYADLYKLPLDVIKNINKHVSMGQKVYLGCAPKYSLYAYDNNKYAIHSYAKYPEKIQVVVRGESSYIRNVETGEEFRERIFMQGPSHMHDATTNVPEEDEYAYELQIPQGATFIFEVK